MLWLAAAPALAADGHWNVSLSGSLFQPWYGDHGYGAQLAAQYALREGHFWIGVEVEHREFDPDLGGSFRPDYRSVLLRGLFHYHPFPELLVSPYVGLGTGLALHVSDRKGREDGTRRRIRRSVSGGTTFLGLVGAQARVPGTERLSFFLEARVESAGDYWKKRGANWQFDQVGGVSGTLGVRARF